MKIFSPTFIATLIFGIFGLHNLQTTCCDNKKSTEPVRTTHISKVSRLDIDKFLEENLEWLENGTTEPKTHSFKSLVNWAVNRNTKPQSKL